MSKSKWKSDVRVEATSSRSRKRKYMKVWKCVKLVQVEAGYRSVQRCGSARWYRIVQRPVSVSGSKGKGEEIKPTTMN